MNVNEILSLLKFETNEIDGHQNKLVPNESLILDEIDSYMSYTI